MLSKDGEMTRFRFSFIRVSTGSALSRREGERGHCFQGGQTPYWQLLKLPLCRKGKEHLAVSSRGKLLCLLGRGPWHPPIPHTSGLAGGLTTLSVPTGRSKRVLVPYILVSACLPLFHSKKKKKI